MRRLIFPLLLLFIISACGQKSTPKASAVDPKAKKLNDSAMLIAMKREEYTKAILLLDQATQIDTSYFTAYRNKLTFQLQLRQYEQALVTAFKMSKLRPDNPDHYVTIGILYDLKSDTRAAKKYYTEAEKYYEKMLATMSSSDHNYDMLLMNRALNLIFLGEQEKGNDILREMYKSQTNDIFKQIIGSYINKSKKDIINLWLTPVTAVSVSQPN